MDEPEERKDEQHLELRRQYRESALTLSSASDSSVGWATSQSLLDTFWDDREVASGQPILYACQACGFILHPGFLGTTLRTARSKKCEVTRTRQRREQRRKRKAAIAKQHRKRVSNIPRSIDSIRKEGATVVILEDDQSVVFDRHHLVITCGKCRSSVRCKGVKREASNSKILSPTERSSGVAHKKEKTPALKSASDFLALPPVATTAANASTMQKEPRKKKKKSATPKSSLMSFLNSLND